MKTQNQCRTPVVTIESMNYIQRFPKHRQYRGLQNHTNVRRRETFSIRPVLAFSTEAQNET